MPAAQSAAPSGEARRLGDMARGRRLTRRFQTRPFFVSTAAILLLALYRYVRHEAEAEAEAGGSPMLQRRQLDPGALAVDDVPCRLIHQAVDKCAFVRAHCEDEAAGLLPYLPFYYCTMARAQPAAFALLVVWLGLLFTTIGIAASDFFSVNLGTISHLLGLSESLAGVTFLAFGNGSPDVFSTFAAMGSNSGSMAVGELIGAAGFITAVVAGSMALVREFPVSRYTFVRDIGFFIAAVAFAMIFLADGRLLLWECCTMIGFYIFYVLTVVGWHWVSKRRRQRRKREAVSRGEYHDGPADERTGGDAGGLAPYRDNPDAESGGDDDDDDSAPVGSRRTAAPPDISALERGPRIMINSVAAADAPGVLEEGRPGGEVQADEEDEEERNRHINAEMTSSMRVNRPRGRRSTTMTPIRPSLLGVLEFRSVLSSLQRSGTVRLAPLVRRASAHGNGFGSGSGYEASAAHALHADDSRSYVSLPDGSARSRALSSGDMPRTLPDGALASSAPPDGAGDRHSPQTDMPSIDSSLVLPEAAGGSPSPTVRPSLPTLHLEIPGDRSPRSSPALSPFPDFSELSPVGPSRQSSFGLSVTSDHSSHRAPQPYYRGSTSDVDDADSRRTMPHKPVRWWPYNVLPPPHVVVCTLFPMMQRWREKTVWDKFVSLISLPTVFLLVITLPVVEMEEEAEEAEQAEEDGPDGRSLSDGGSVAVTGAGGIEGLHSVIHAVEAHEDGVDRDNRDDGDNGDDRSAATLQPETEWQRYRRSTNAGRRPTSRELSPVHPEDGAASSSRGTPIDRSSITKHLATAGVGDVGGVDGVAEEERRADVVAAYAAESAGGVATEAATGASGWNRWLVAVQLYAGPLFTVLVVWANMEDDGGAVPARAGRLLGWMVLGVLGASTALLALLLWTTTAERRPRRHATLCFLGFVISVAWISTVAGEVVGVLKTIGVVVGISEAVLGLTVFAVGNSLGDLVADITVARLGFPVMALSACFGGPMLNILLGIGMGGAWMTARGSGSGGSHQPYVIEIGGTLLVSAVTVLVTLVVLLVVVPANGWVMNRRIGIALICIWAVSTVMNVVIELAGVWVKE